MRSSRLVAPMTMTLRSPSTPSISASSWGTIVDSMSERDARAAGAEHRVHLVEEDDDRPALLALLPRPLEHEADLALGLADVLVEQLGALDVDEVAAALLVAGRRGDLLGEAVGDGLGDQGLAAARAGRRAGCPWVPAGGARRTAPGGGTAARRRRRSARSGRRARRCRRRRCRAPPRAGGPRPRGGAASRAAGWSGGRGASCRPGAGAIPRRASASSHTRSSSARPTTSARTPSSISSLTVTTSPVGLRATGQDHVEALVEHDLRAAVERVEVDVRVGGHLHLAPAGEDVDRAVLVLADHDAVRRRRLGELVDLVAQRGDVLARLAEGVAQLLVLGHGLGQLALGLEQPLLQGAHALRARRRAGPAGGRSPRSSASTWARIASVISSPVSGTLHLPSGRSEGDAARQPDASATARITSAAPSGAEPSPTPDALARNTGVTDGSCFHAVDRVNSQQFASTEGEVSS